MSICESNNSDDGSSNNNILNFINVNNMYRILSPKLKL